jgi:hypothetical protein
MRAVLAPQTPFDHTTPRFNNYAFLHQARAREALLYIEILLLCRAGVQLLFGGDRSLSRRCELRRPSSTHQRHMQAGCNFWMKKELCHLLEEEKQFDLP